jgi:2-hydroxycyclohexanecarboxyl-CoA dehydrogenase
MAGSELDRRTRVIVTGAASGIGRAIARGFTKQGARVLIADRAPTGAAVADEMGALFQRSDVSRREEMQAAVARAVAEFGGVEVLVNCAGIEQAGPFLESDEAIWDQILAVNLKGTILSTRAVLDVMVAAGRGKIVNIASDAGRVGSSGEVVYSASKGGVIAFTKALAREVARYRINVNCVAPGPCRTPLLDAMTQRHAGLVQSLEKAIPWRRLAEPEDIVGAVLFLASPAADYITGQTLSVSGGLTMV